MGILITMDTAEAHLRGTAFECSVITEYTKHARQLIRYGKLAFVMLWTFLPGSSLVRCITPFYCCPLFRAMSAPDYRSRVRMQGRPLPRQFIFCPSPSAGFTLKAGR